MCDAAATRRRRFPLHFALARFQHPRDCLSRPPDAESPIIGFSWQWLTPAPSDASAASSTATYTMARRTICSPTSTSMVSARTTKQSAERCPRIARPRKPRPPASAPVRAPQCRNVFKPYDRRLEREGFVESEEDDPQIIIHIPFISPVKIRALSVIGGADGETPRELRAFINRETLDFSDADALAAPVSTHSPPYHQRGCAPFSHPSERRQVQQWEIAERDPTGGLEYPTQVLARLGRAIARAPAHSAHLARLAVLSLPERLATIALRCR